MKSQVVVTFAAAAVLGAATSVVAMVEECPSYCSPVNNNYGPACATVRGPPSDRDRAEYITFSNLCELYKQRCYNRMIGGPVIEFVSDGSCSSSVKKTNECRVICSPENNKFGSVCATVGGSFRSFPNLCVMLREKCTNERSGQPEIKYVKDGSCSIPMRHDREDMTPQASEPVQRREMGQMVEDPTKDDAQVIENPMKPETN